MRRRIFVFGSNTRGLHYSGAALYAKNECGADMGVGEGLTGDSYALPTCSGPGTPSPRGDVRAACARFRRFAIDHPELDFLLTAVGCGIAGFCVDEVAEWLGHLPDNVYVQAKLIDGYVVNALEHAHTYI